MSKKQDEPKFKSFFSNNLTGKSYDDVIKKLANSVDILEKRVKVLEETIRRMKAGI